MRKERKSPELILRLWQVLWEFLRRAAGPLIALLVSVLLTSVIKGRGIEAVDVWTALISIGAVTLLMFIFFALLWKKEPPETMALIKKLRSAHSGEALQVLLSGSMRKIG